MIAICGDVDNGKRLTFLLYYGSFHFCLANVLGRSISVAYTYKIALIPLRSKPVLFATHKVHNMISLYQLRYVYNDNLCVLCLMKYALREEHQSNKNKTIRLAHYVHR